MPAFDWATVALICMLLLTVVGVLIAVIVLGIVRNIIYLLNGQVQNQGKRLDAMQQTQERILQSLPRMSDTVIVSPPPEVHDS